MKHSISCSNLASDCQVREIFLSNRVPEETRWGGGGGGVMKIIVGREETRFLGRACKCFSRNPAQMNGLNGVAWSTSVRHKSSIP